MKSTIKIKKIGITELNTDAIVNAAFSDEDEDDNGLYITRKFIPALLNGERVNLIVEFNEETGIDSVLGAQSVTETGVLGKGYAEMNGGDVIELICDYYTYDGEYVDSYYFGEKMKVTSDMKISDTVVGNGAVKILYRFTDIYNQEYWTEAINVK